MKLNGVEVVERHNRPGTLNRVLLRANFISNGAYKDPYDISAVTLHTRAANTAPSSILVASSQVVDEEYLSGTSLKFRWSPSGTVGTVADCLDPNQYAAGGASTSSIFKLDTGQFVVVLDGISRTSVRSQDINESFIVNTASGAGTYIDVWTVKMTEDSDWQVIINNVELFQDNLVITTEPIMVRTKNKLIPNEVRLGEVVDLKVTTEVNVMNKNIDQTIKNTFTQSLVDEPKFLIKKHNEDSNLPSWVDVSGFEDTSGFITTTSDNTMVMSFDTSVLTSGAITNLGAGRGTYSVEAKYNVLSETIISPMMYFTVR
jgi:hypothetical protein